METNKEEQLNENNGNFYIIAVNWEEISDNENEQDQKVEEVKQAPKKQLLKDKHGEIIITKLEEYVEPTKQVREARGDKRMQQGYDFGDLSVDEESEEDEDNDEESEEEETETQEDKKKKKNVKPEKKKEEDLDDLLKEFGGNNFY
jgi:hypothetical protein